MPDPLSLEEVLAEMESKKGNVTGVRGGVSPRFGPKTLHWINRWAAAIRAHLETCRAPLLSVEEKEALAVAESVLFARAWTHSIHATGEAARRLRALLARESGKEER